MTTLILYSKPGCHLCEGLEAKLIALQQPPFNLALTLEVRNITEHESWFRAYQYEIPVLCRLLPETDAQGIREIPLPRPSPKLSVAQLQRFLQKHL